MHPLVTSNFWHAILLAYLGLLGLLVACWLLFGLAVLITAVFFKIDDGARAEKRRLRKLHKDEAEQKRIDELLSSLGLMVCSNDAAQVDIKALPKSKRTIHLRFNGLKKQVCRPFAK
jgi:hypothetical protein